MLDARLERAEGEAIPKSKSGRTSHLDLLLHEGCAFEHAPRLCIIFFVLDLRTFILFFCHNRISERGSVNDSICG